MTYDAEKAKALVAGAMADEERMTPGPWSDANGKGSAVVRSNHPDYNCAIYINVRNGEVKECVERWQRDASAIASMRNRNRAMAEMLAAAMDEVERLRTALIGDDVTLALNQRACAEVGKQSNEALDEACARVIQQLAAMTAARNELAEIAARLARGNRFESMSDDIYGRISELRKVGTPGKDER